METTIADYVGIGHLPEGGKVTCKFLILDRQGIYHLIVGPVQTYRYHANLLDRFCAERDIAASWAKKPDYVEVFDRSVVLHGGGWMELDGESRKARLYGASTAYGAYRVDLARRIIADHPHFARFHVTFSR